MFATGVFEECCVFPLTGSGVVDVPGVLGLDAAAADWREEADEQQPAQHPAASCQAAGREWPA